MDVGRFVRRTALLIGTAMAFGLFVVLLAEEDRHEYDGSAVLSDAPVVDASETRLDACFAGACGSAIFTWDSGGDDVANISMSVKDSKCDSHPVYIRLAVYDRTVGSPYFTTKRWNSNGCSAGYDEWHGLYINWGLNIYALRVQACVDDAGTDTCRLSEAAYNPYW